MTALEFLGVAPYYATNPSMGLMTGTIPSEIYNLRALKLLALEFNLFSGPIHTMIGSLTSLTILALRHNLFSGTLPTEIGRFSPKGIFLTHNMLSGTLPTELAGYTHLLDSFLGNNDFFGQHSFGLWCWWWRMWNPQRQRQQQDWFGRARNSRLVHAATAGWVYPNGIV